MVSRKMSDWSAKINNAIRFFLYLLIFWLPYSSAVVENCVIIAFVLWLFKRAFITKTFRFPLTSLNISVIFFLAACIFSTVGSPFLSDSIQSFFTKTLEWFVIFFLVIEVFQTRKHIYIFLIVFGATSLITCMDALVQYYVTFKDIFGRTILPFSRATAAFKAPNSLGAYLTIVIPTFFVLQFGAVKGLWKNVGFFILFCFSLWAVALSDSHGAWIGTVIGLAVATVFFEKLKKKEFSGLFSRFFLLLRYCSLPQNA